MNHTPGPWEIRRHIKTAIGNGDKQIALVSLNDKVREEEHEANVNLLVMAPEMFEILEELERLSSMGPEHSAPVRVRAREIIAKVRGYNE